jgi:hypothetical protein
LRSFFEEIYIPDECFEGNYKPFGDGDIFEGIFFNWDLWKSFVGLSPIA